MSSKCEIRKDAYYDSVTLMLASGKMCDVPGVKNAAAMMGTDHNRALMKAAGLIDGDLQFSPNDAVIGILAEEDAAVDKALAALDEFLTKKAASGAKDIKPKTLEGAKRLLPEANLEIISVPGRFAAAEAEKALDMGMHVLLFSDNVTIEDEIKLKEKAVEKGLLMMGPDCGTAIINGIALGFANAVRRGGIGLAAAAGTGLQEATVLIERFGGGVSQALGTGGRDLKEAVGGLMMKLCLNALESDPGTDTIVIVSKPPHPTVMAEIAKQISAFKKPVVSCFLGGNPEILKGSGAIWAKDIESAARIAVSLSTGINREKEEEAVSDFASSEASLYKSGQIHLRGLYSGGTLCYESMLALGEAGLEIRSNIAQDKKLQLEDPEQSVGHTLLDMGDDYFTNGMAHPMIDPRQRAQRVLKEAEDPSVAVILLDCVGGYGSHENPAGAIAGAIKKAKRLAAQEGRHLTVVASVCGTEGDPQKRGDQENILREAGAVVAACNGDAARLGAEIARKIS
ncbi:MAG: acyl-CoA synthetase FdrA [Clostridiales bacterium]|jgi:succinyl-CoA synthetase alpha subunit|nr:acyl-CoA synthetase FdrA [Clostridiales bacterium]